jgi:hypothetical protein
MYSRAEILEHAKRIGKSRTTLRRWVSEGCDLRNHASVQAWIEKNKRRETNVSKSRQRRGVEQRVSSRDPEQSSTAVKRSGNGDTLPSPGKRGATAALERLEEQEERAHARLQIALQGGDPVVIDAAQTYWLRCSEVLRRLDLAVELALRLRSRIGSESVLQYF